MPTDATGGEKIIRGRFTVKEQKSVVIGKDLKPNLLGNTKEALAYRRLNEFQFIHAVQTFKVNWQVFLKRCEQCLNGARNTEFQTATHFLHDAFYCANNRVLSQLYDYIIALNKASLSCAQRRSVYFGINQYCFEDVYDVCTKECRFDVAYIGRVDKFEQGTNAASSAPGKGKNKPASKEWFCGGLHPDLKHLSRENTEKQIDSMKDIIQRYATDSSSRASGWGVGSCSSSSEDKLALIEIEFSEFTQFFFQAKALQQWHLNNQLNDVVFLCKLANLSGRERELCSNVSKHLLPQLRYHLLLIWRTSLVASVASKKKGVSGSSERLRNLLLLALKLLGMPHYHQFMKQLSSLIYMQYENSDRQLSKVLDEVIMPLLPLGQDYIDVFIMLNERTIPWLFKHWEENVAYYESRLSALEDSIPNVYSPKYVKPFSFKISCHPKFVMQFMRNHNQFAANWLLADINAIRKERHYQEFLITCHEVYGIAPLQVELWLVASLQNDCFNVDSTFDPYEVVNEHVKYLNTIAQKIKLHGQSKLVLLIPEIAGKEQAVLMWDELNVKQAISKMICRLNADVYHQEQEKSHRWANPYVLFKYPKASEFVRADTGVTILYSQEEQKKGAVIGSNIEGKKGMRLRRGNG